MRIGETRRSVTDLPSFQSATVVCHRDSSLILLCVGSDEPGAVPRPTPSPQGTLFRDGQEVYQTAPRSEVKLPSVPEFPTRDMGLLESA